MINFDDFLRYLKSEFDRYASQNGKTFFVSLDKLWAFIGINFVMGYHEIPTLRSYWEIGNVSIWINYKGEMTRERFKVIINNLQFSYNEEAVPREHPDHGQIFKIR